MIDRLDQMMVGPAMSTRLPFEDVRGDCARLQRSMTKRAQGLLARLQKDGRGLVGQEAVKLSTTPVYVDGKLEPRPFVLRVFAARHKDGWSFMPGGFARVGFTLDTAAIAMQRGGQAADVWITSSGPVAKDTLLPREDDTFRRNVPGTLPSRVCRKPDVDGALHRARGRDGAYPARLPCPLCRGGQYGTAAADGNARLPEAAGRQSRYGDSKGAAAIH